MYLYAISQPNFGVLGIWFLVKNTGPSYICIYEITKNVARQTMLQECNLLKWSATHGKTNLVQGIVRALSINYIT